MNLNDLYQKTNLTEGEQNYGPEWDEKVRRLGQMAAQGPRKTVWDPVKRVYKTVPVNAPKKEQGMAEGNYDDNRTGFRRPNRDLSGEGEPSGMFAVVIDGRPWKEFTSNKAFQVAKTIATKYPDKKVQVKWPTGQLNTVTGGSGAQIKTDDNFRNFLAQRKVGEEQLDEIIDPSTAAAKALRYVGRKFATAFPWLAVGGVGAGLAATGLMAPIVASMGGISTALSALSAEMAFSAGMAGTYAAPSIIQTIKDLFAADENSIQSGIKRWVEKYVGDDNDVQEFMLVHSKAAYEGKPGFRWRAKEWPVKMSREQAEAYLEKNDKMWLDMEKQKVIDAEKAKADKEKADKEVNQELDENLHKWFKEKWVRFGTGGKSNESVAESEDIRPQGKILKKLHDIAYSSPALTFQNFRQSGKEAIITDAIMACKVLKHHYLQNKNQPTAQIIYNLENELDNFMRGRKLPTPDGNEYTMDLSDLLKGTLGKMRFQQKVDEDQLDEKWTKKYKDSINCSNPKGFSQKAHCAGKQKNESAIMSGLNQLDEGWKEKLGAAALAGSMALGAGGAQARVTYDADGNQIGGLKPTTTQQASPLKAQAQYDINTQILTYNGKQYKWNSQSQATGQGEVVSAPSMAVGSRSMGPTKVELNPNGTYTKAAIDEDQVLESLSRIAELAGVPVKDNLLEYGAPGSRALGTANFALLHRAYVNKRPRLSRNLRLEFGPNQAVDLDDDDIEAIAGYYDTLPTDQDRYNFVYDIMSRGDKFTALLRKLGRRGDLLEQDSKKKSSNPLDRKDVKSVSLNNALRQAYAKYPQANSDIEALALHDLNYQQNTNKDLSAQAKINKRQDAIDNQLKDLARKQSSKISDLDQENDELSAELDQLNQEINAMSQQVGIKPKDTAKDSDKPSVINLNVGDRGERSQQRQADVKQRDVQKSAPAVTTSPAIGQVAQSLANPPAPTIDVIDEPAVALPAKMGAAPAVPDSDGGEQLSMFGPEPEAVPAKSVNTVSEPPAEVPTTLAAPDADEPAELPANVSDLDKARRTRDQLRKATAQQAYDAIKTGTFESKDNSSLFSSLLEMESAKENHRNLVCEMCGRTASDHPFRHPFKVSNK